MARALWSGAIAFGLVNIPVKLYGATETKDLSFTTLHATCMTALKRPYICPKDNVPVDSKEMVKGYEYAKGQYVILKDEDFEKIPLEATKALDVAGFVDASEISPLYRERNYYLGPEEISLKPFELFRQALMRTGKVALARAVLWKKEQLVAISPYNGSLVLTTLMYQDEVKAPPDPYLHVIKPMLAESRETPFDSKDHIFELKWDGTRALAIVRDGLRFQNRRLNYVESRYPDLTVHTRKPAILDGEIVVMNGPLPSFEKLQERERASGKIKIEYLAKTLPATYIVFDVLYVGDKSVMGLSQMERKAILPDLVEVDDRVVLSDYIEGRGVDYYNAVIARGLEGIIAKHKETRYQVGKRSKDWVKIKKKTTLDAIICGITAGEGERTDTFGSLILGAYFEGALFHVGRVGTGFSEKLRRTLFQRLVALRAEERPVSEGPEIDAHVGVWAKPQIVVAGHFLRVSQDRHMRAPSFARLREDKQPEDCGVSFLAVASFLPR